MKIPRHGGGGGAAYDVPMTPMIDVVFLLLVFFVWTAGFQTVEYRLPGAVAPPASAGSSDSPPPDVPPPAADFDQVVVRIVQADDRPLWRINDQPVESLDAVLRSLQAIAAVRADVPVVLHPDGPVAVGQVIDAYDAARQAGFAQIRFAAARPITPPSPAP